MNQMLRLLNAAAAETKTENLIFRIFVNTNTIKRVFT